MDTILTDMLLVNKIIIFVLICLLIVFALWKIHDLMEHYLKKKIENGFLVGVITTITCLEVVAFFAAIIDLSCKYFLGKL